MGSLGSRFQASSQEPEEAAEGSSTSHKHGCECKKRKRDAQCDCEIEQEEDALLDTPRRQVSSISNQLSRISNSVSPFALSLVVCLHSGFSTLTGRN